MSKLVLDVLPWFAGFFILDALMNLQRGQVVFSRLGFGRTALLRLGLRLVGASPFGRSVVAYELPFMATPGGLWLFDPGVQSAPPVVEEGQLTFVAWEELGAVEVSRSTVRSAAHVVFRARSARDAQRMAAGLRRLKELSFEARADALEERSAQAFEVEAVRDRWRRVRLPARLAATFGTLETAVLFVALPAVALHPGAGEAHWSFALGALLGLHALAVGAAGWTFARWGLPGAERGGALFQMLLLPVYAARAGVQSVREAFSEFEPLAIAAVLLAPEDLVRLARRELVRTEASRARARDPGLVALFTARLEHVEALLAACALSREQVLAPPGGSAPFCPLCLGEHRAGFTVCADCTVPLEQPPHAPTGASRAG